MKIHWLLPSLLGICCLAAPAEAGQLSSWRFDSAQNRLEFNTDEGVQPRAQLLVNPTRLVIDLPGTTIAASPLNQTVGREIQQIRIGQLDAQTTRIVVDLAPGYTLDPQQIRFRGISPMQWTVQLPQPQRVNSTVTSALATLPNPTSENRTTLPSTLSVPASGENNNAARATGYTVTQVNGIRVTADGMFVRTEGARAAVEVKRGRRDRETITVLVRNAVLSPQLIERNVTVNRYGISDVELSQTSPTQVQLVLRVAKDSPDWQASASGAGGIVILPQGGIAAVAQLAPPAPTETAPAESASANPPAAAQPAVLAQPARPRTQTATPTGTPPAAIARTTAPPVIVPSSEIPPGSDAQIATIQSIEVNAASNQFLVRSDRPTTYSGRWQSGLYQISISPAQLAANVSGTDVGGANSPVLRVRLRQQNQQTVVISVQPASGVRFGTLNRVSPQLLALEMERSPNPSSPNFAANAVQSAAPNSSNGLAPRPRQPVGLPNVQNGRLLVVLDPGHGGSDPGAVGINGLQEKQIVLPIAQQVAAYLEQQGVQTILTRTDDSDVELEPRVQMAEQSNATLFVSIHANSISLDRSEVNGVETYYFASGEQMARVIQDSIIQGTGMNDRGIRQSRFYVLRRTSMPAVLVEVGFVTGSEDAPRLANEGFRSQMARAIAQGILQYIRQNSTAFNR
ncbi:MAG: AMIN domain-containing protein [Leptolyngbyaceae cyanobacterium CRU_2_3]|nr:AMIN domain-containing protein [Leptolyngbyaceae cyanobacterium CRU_2_3]